MKPHRGIMILVFGILGLVVCQLFGIAAWVMGRTFELSFRFEAVPEGTRVYRNGDFHPSPLIWPLLPLIGRDSA